MTIADKLTLLEQTKEAQRVKLGLPKNLPFSQYIKFIRDPFTIAELYKNGEQGIWLDPSDLSTMFLDVNGLEPVTKDGQPVGLIKDKSGNNNHATQPTASARPIYRTDGNLHWLEFDGIDDGLIVEKLNTNPDFTVHLALDENKKSTVGYILQDSANYLQRYATVYWRFRYGNGSVTKEIGGTPAKSVISLLHRGSSSEIWFNKNRYDMVGGDLGMSGKQYIFSNPISTNFTPVKANLYALLIRDGKAIQELTIDYLATKAGIKL